MTVTGTPVDKASILNSFIAMVKDPFMAGVTGQWHDANKPFGTMNHHLLGNASEPNPGWPANTGEVTTTNVFYLLHGFALKLTRHRRAHLWHITTTTPSPALVATDHGIRLTSYAPNNIVWFDYPSIPPVGQPITSGDINNFLSALRANIESIRGNDAFTADMVACHSSCHTPACHSSRGRR